MKEELLALAQELKAALVEMTPEAWALMVEMTRVDGVATVVMAVPCFLGFVATAVITNRLLVKYENDEVLWAGALVTGTIAVSGFFVAMLLHLLDKWAWIAIWNPELALVHDLLTKVGG